MPAKSMKNYLLLLAALLPMGASALEEAPLQQVVVVAKKDSEWQSYRHAYKASAFFDKYTRSRPLIQAHMQIRPNRPGLPMNNLRIALEGETYSTQIPVDRIGRAILPMHKQAYVEDAVLRLNRLKGNYHFSGRYSIRERADGIYSFADLRAACDQLLDAQRDSGYRVRLIGKKCAGVTFIYASETAAPEISVKHGNESKVLVVADSAPFESQTVDLLKVAKFRFADWTGAGTVVATTRPIAIGTIYE
jgi:hypothetical protein